MKLALIRMFATFGLLGLGQLCQAEKKPNIVVILCDDMGYGDLGCFGAKGWQTPHIDSIAKNGVKLTDFYVAQPVCSASRAALITGCYPNRIGIHGALFPHHEVGLNPSETTLAELCKSSGYATAMYGKWHLGYQKKFLPVNHGFDDYLGLPYSNDMWPHGPVHFSNAYPELPLIEDDEIVLRLRDQTDVTTWITERSVNFIEQHAKSPFFLYLAHPQPHVPLYISKKHRGTSAQGMYGDVMHEIDWSTGRILEALEKSGLTNDTLVIFTSDNGPHIEGGHLPDFFDSNGPYRGYKRDLYEGGIRVPLIARWPSKIKAGTSSGHPSAHWDTLATFCEIAELPIPEDTDGISFLPTLFQQPQKQHDYLYWEFPARGGRRAASFGPELNWKAVQYDMMKDPNAPIEIYRLDQDPGETKDLAKKHPEKVAQAKEIFTEAHTTSGRFPFQWEKPKGLTVSLISESKTIVPGQPLTLGLHIKHQPGFHTYWKSPGQVGVPTSIDWTVPEGFEVSEISWPSPEITYMADYQSHGYKRDVTLLVTLTPPTKISEKAVTISAKTNWMCCAQSCHPDGWEFFLNLPISAATQPIQQSAKLIEKARTEVPTVAKNWQATLLSSSDESPIRILLSGTSTETPSYFFSEDGQISSKHKQEFVRKGPGFWELTIERAEYSPKQKKSLPGVLKTAKGSFHIQPHYLK